MVLEWLFGAGLIGLVGTFAGVIASRLREVEARLEESHAENVKLWMYTRRLIDLYYRHRRDDAPDVPKLDMFTDG